MVKYTKQQITQLKKSEFYRKILNWWKCISFALLTTKFELPISILPFFFSIDKFQNKKKKLLNYQTLIYTLGIINSVIVILEKNKK